MEASGKTEPPCPHCLEHRPRTRYPSGTLSAYCKECNRDIVRERSGYSKAERTCERCGNTYRGNSRAKAQVCKDCRSKCVTCEADKSPGDKSHAECYRCRAVGKVCITCGEKPPFGNRRECWDCADADGAEGAKNRDRIYSLAPGQYDQMLAAQNGLCAISGQPETSVSKSTGKIYPLAADHDRRCCPGYKSCGKCLRDLIRRNLNVALGMFNDDPALLRAAANYIERHRAAREQRDLQETISAFKEAEHQLPHGLSR